MSRIGVALATLLVALHFLSGAIPSPACAQESGDTPEVRIERLEKLDARLDRLFEHHSRTEGEDRELIEDQLARRWLESHELLGVIVDDYQGLPEGDASASRVRDVIQASLTKEIDFLQTVLGARQSQIAGLRLVRPEKSPQELIVLEEQLTELNIKVDRIQGALLENYERGEIAGLTVAEPQVQLDADIARRATVIAARVELAREQRSRLMTKLDRPGTDTESIQKEIWALDEKLYGTTTSLQSMVDLMNQRGQETASHQQLILEVTGDLGTSILDPKVVAGLFARWARDVWHWLGENAGGILVKILSILLVMTAAVALGRVSRKAVGRALQASSTQMSRILQNLVLTLASKLIVVVGILISLSILGINIGPMLAGLGIAGFILGFALQETLSNFAAGLMIMIYRPFDVGDVIKAATVLGEVKKLTLVSTVVTTFDNQRMVIPNNKVWGDVINNITAEKIRRVDLTFGIGYADDIEKAKGIMLDVVENHEKILKDPEPNVRVHKLGESSVDFICRPWCRTEDYWDVYWDVIQTVKQRFDAEGVSIPFPQRDVHMFHHADSQGGPSTEVAAASGAPERPGGWKRQGPGEDVD